jgi:histidyl-tRNA synthetase
MKEANRSNAKFALIVGEQELQTGKLILRDLEKSEQCEVGLEKLVEVIRNNV